MLTRPLPAGHALAPASGGAFRARSRRVGALVLLIGVLWLLLPAPAASAHAYLLASTPPGGYAVATAPTEVSLDFDRPVTIGATSLVLADTAGAVHEMGPAMLSLAGRRLTAPISAPLPSGGYRIRWEVTADDGDVVAGAITFTVGTGAGVPEDGSGGDAVDSPLVVVARWALFSGLALGLGGLVGGRLVRRVQRDMDAAAATPAATTRAATPQPWVLTGSVLAGAAAVVLAVDQVGLDPGQLVGTGPGRVLGVEATALAAAALFSAGGRHRQRPRLHTATGVALLTVVAAEGLRAHPHAASPIWGTTLTTTHLLAVTIWTGALLHVLRIAHHWRHRAGATRLLIHDYARLALLLVAVVIATGSAEALIVLPDLAALVTTAYGRVLLAKITLVAVILALAALNRRRLHRSATTGGRPLGRAVRAETAALVAVLAVTAVLVSLAPPGPAVTDLAAPPPPIGPVVPIGTLAGQITLIATASAGQLVIRMTSPGRDDLGTDTTSPYPTASGARAAAATYRVVALLSAPAAPDATLTLRGCGPGCFTTPLDWRTGLNQLHLTVTAPPWTGSTALLDIPWPARTDPTVLPAVLAAMRAVPRMTVHQSVTSNYTGNPGPATPLPFTGGDFLATEPYGSGGGNPVVLADRRGDTELGLGFPGGIAIRLFIGTDHRILREEQTTPNHLITSTFEYPPGPGP